MLSVGSDILNYSEESKFVVTGILVISDFAEMPNPGTNITIQKINTIFIEQNYLGAKI